MPRIGRLDLQHVALSHDELVFLLELAGEREDVGRHIGMAPGRRAIAMAADRQAEACPT
jgi:hypothetical protein